MIATWAMICVGMFFVYFLWALSRWTNKRNAVKDNVRRVKRNYRNRLWINANIPLEKDDFEDGVKFAYEKLLDEADELVQ